MPRRRTGQPPKPKPRQNLTTVQFGDELEEWLAKKANEATAEHGVEVTLSHVIRSILQIAKAREAAGIQPVKIPLPSLRMHRAIRRLRSQNEAAAAEKAAPAPLHAQPY